MKKKIYKYTTQDNEVNERSQNFLIFQPIFKTFKVPAGLTKLILECESKGLSNENIKSPVTANHRVSPKLIWATNSRIRGKFKGCYLKQAKATFTPRNVVNIFIVYELSRWSEDLNADFTLKNCLFGAIKLTKNADADKIFLSGHCIGLDSRLLFNFEILIGVKMVFSY